MKVKIHFNRVNMQRGDNRCWSAHTSKACNMSETVEIRYKGKTIAKTIFKPTKKDNPRAWIETQGIVSHEGDITVIEVG